MPDQPGSLAAALTAFQASMPPIAKTADAPYGKYADLHVITAAVLPVLASLGLYWTCAPTMLDGAFVLRYRLEHVSQGQPIEGFYPLPNATPQTIGGAITYARRYALCAVLGIAPAGEDDDGQAAEAWRPPANPRTRKADRHSARRDGPLPDDDWTVRTSADAEFEEDAHGSITPAQRSRLMASFNKAGILAREDRLAYAMSKLDLPELATSNDLSMRQAGQLIATLEAEDTP